jgi:pimeloyl-ACP methyl ester carboxylesterase
MTLRGRTVAWREAGLEHDAPPAILAHCSLAHSGLWKPILAALGERRPVIALDMPAHGRSDPPPEGESLQLFAAEACAALVDRLGRPAHMVGLSLGGAALARLAVRAPERALSLTLIEPVLFHLLLAPGEAPPPPPDFMRPEMEVREGARRFVEQWGAPGGWEALGPEGQDYAAKVYPHLRDDQPMVNARPEGQIELSDMAALPMPALLIDGAESPPNAGAVLDAIQGALPGARRRTIAGAGHLSPVTHWREVLAELQDFFAAAEASRASA